MNLKQLKTLRRHRKIKIKELSRLTGISRNVISRIENGNGNPSFENVNKLVEGLGLQLRVLDIKI